MMAALRNANILRMNDADTVRFLRLYRNERILWDSTMDEYKKRDCRAAAAKRIATSLNIRGFTEMHVILKFKNLRSSYSQELKKIKDGGGGYVPKVIWFNLMDSFLKPHVKSRAGQQNTNIHKREDYPDTNVQSSAEIKQEPDLATEASTSQETVDGEMPTLRKKRTYLDTPKPHNSRKKCSEISGSESDTPTASEMSEMEDTSRTPAPVPMMVNDNLEHFGKYVTSLLRSFPLNKALQLQAEIIALISKQYDNYLKESRPSTPR